MTRKNADPADTRTEGSIKDDFIEALRPRTISHRGIFAGTPLALVAVLALASVAVGATIVRNVVVPGAEPTPVIVADATPTSPAQTEPAVEPTAEPTAPATEPAASPTHHRASPTEPATTAEPTPPATAEPTPATTAEPTRATTAEPTEGPATPAPSIEPTWTPSPTPVAPTIADLGTLAAADNLDMTVSFAWGPYNGPNLYAYTVAYEATSSGKTPGFPGSESWAVTRGGKTSARVGGIGPGTYLVRAFAICVADGQGFVCGQTNVIRIHLSAGRYSPTPQPTDAPTPPATQQPTPEPPSTPSPEPTTVAITDLGPLSAADNLDMTVSFGWNAYTGPNLYAYDLVYELSSSGKTPGFPGSPSLGLTHGGTSIAVSGIAPGR